MDPSPTPPRRFSHWKTTKRTFVFGKSKSTKSPDKQNKKSNTINKSVSKIQESSIHVRKYKKNNSVEKRLSDLGKKKSRKNSKPSIFEHSNESDQEDSAETSSVDKENKDRTHVDNLVENIRKGKIINKLDDSSIKVTGKIAPKRKLSLQSSEDFPKEKQPKSLLLNKAANENNSHSSDSEFQHEVSQAKRRKKKDGNAHYVQNNLVSIQGNVSRDSNSSQEVKKSFNRELKRLSRSLMSSNLSVLHNESGNSTRVLRDRSLLMTKEAMQDQKQYPLSFYFSEKKLEKTITGSNSSSNTSKDLESSRSNKVNIFKNKSLKTSLQREVPNLNVNLSPSTKRSNEVSVNVEVTELAVLKSKVVRRQSEVNKNVTSSELKQSVPNSSFNTNSDENYAEPSAKKKMKNSQNLHPTELQNENQITKRQSEKSKEKLLEVSSEDSATSKKINRGRKKTENDNQVLPKSPHHILKQKNGKIVEKTTKRSEKANSSLFILQPVNSPQKTVPNPEVSVKGHAGLRKNARTISPDQKQYPISYYYSNKHQSDLNSDDGDICESSGSKKNIKTHLAKKQAQTFSPRHNNTDKLVLKSRKSKASKVSVSTSVFISNREIRKSPPPPENDKSDTSSSPEPQTIRSPSPKKRAASPRKMPVKSSLAKDPLNLGGSMCRPLESIMDGTVLASQKTQRRRNLIQDLDTLETPADPKHQGKKKGQGKEVHVWCEEGRSRYGSDLSAYDVLLEHIETMEQKLIEDELDLNSQSMITKIMDDLRSQLETLLLKRLDLKSIERDLKKAKDRCCDLKEEILKHQKRNSELSSRMKTIQKQSKDLDLLLASSWMKDYAKLMESLGNK